MAPVENKRSLIVAQPGAADWGALSRGIAAWKRIPSIDATHLARHSWGVLGPAGDGDSDPITAFAAQKVSVAWCDSDALPPGVAPGTSISQLSWTDSAWQLRGGSDAVTISSDSLLAIAACAFKDVQTTVVEKKEGPTTGQRLASFGIMAATGLPIRVGPKEKTVEVKKETSELRWVVDLLTADSRRFRLEAERIDYSVLGAQKQYSLMLNFRTLVADMCRRAPQALVNRGTDILQRQRPVHEMGYESLGDLEKEERWLLALSRIRTK